MYLIVEILTHKGEVECCEGLVAHLIAVGRIKEISDILYYAC